MIKNAAALLFGAMLTLAFAPFYIFPMGVIAPAGLLYLLQSANTPRAAFEKGFFFGFGLFSTGVYWIFISIHRFGDVPTWGAFLITFGLVAVLSLFPASTCWLTQRFFKRPDLAKNLFAFPVCWVVIEWVRSWIFGGFPWLLLGYSQTNSPLSGYAPILSVYGISLILVISSGCLVEAAFYFKNKRFQSLYGVLLLLAALWIGGGLLTLIHWTKPTGKSLTVSLIQGNIPQALKWSPEHIELSFDRYETLTKPLLGKSDLIIWPEAAIPLTLQHAESFILSMDQLAEKSHSNIILGIPQQNEEGPGFFNTIISLGKEHQSYAKRRLVPYGEYVPLKAFVGRIFDFMNVPMSDLIPGQRVQPLFTLGNITLNPSICFEIAFPELINTRARETDLLLTVTNDAWFGKSIAQAQHLQMGIMRTLELQRPLLFSSNNGITAIITDKGQISAVLPPYQTKVLTGEVQPMTGTTPWMYYHLIPLFFIMLLLWITAIRYSLRIEKHTLRTL